MADKFPKLPAGNWPSMILTCTCRVEPRLDKAKRLIYRSPVTGDVVIFDHDPF